MSGRGYGHPERVAETGDLAGQAITTNRVADHAGPHPMHENRQKKASRPAGSTETVARISLFCVAEPPYP
jgi:hypothetical protein